MICKGTSPLVFGGRAQRLGRPIMDIRKKNLIFATALALLVLLIYILALKDVLGRIFG